MLSTLRSRRTRYDPGPNLTPLVDVVLVVLIFLMLAGSFGGVTHFLGGTIARGEMVRKRPIPGATVAPASIDLFLQPSGDGLIIRGTELVSTSDLTLLTQRLRLKSDGLIAGGLKPSEVLVVLHPTRGVKYGQLMAVYDAVEGARRDGSRAGSHTCLARRSLVPALR